MTKEEAEKLGQGSLFHYSDIEGDLFLGMVIGRNLSNTQLKTFIYDVERRSFRYDFDQKESFVFNTCRLGLPSDSTISWDNFFDAIREMRGDFNNIETIVKQQLEEDKDESK